MVIPGPQANRASGSCSGSCSKRSAHGPIPLHKHAGCKQSGAISSHQSVTQLGPENGCRLAPLRPRRRDRMPETTRRLENRRPRTNETGIAGQSGQGITRGRIRTDGPPYRLGCRSTPRVYRVAIDLLCRVDIPARCPRSLACNRQFHAIRWRSFARNGARSGNRTRMALRPRDFKSLAYTSFAIRASAQNAR